MFYRFLLAYLCILPINHQFHLQNLKDEVLMALAGITGGTLYFLCENSALQVSVTSNVALIVCTTPVLTAVLSILYLRKEHWTRGLVVGSIVALAGVACVVLNGSMVLHLNPLGDGLALLAALFWAIYSVVLDFLGGKYSTWLVTRKVFFYGLLSMFILLLICPNTVHLTLLMRPVVFGNLLFLGLVASMLCFYSWNLVLKKIGTIRASNYLYVQPLVSLACSVLILKEPLTQIAVIGFFFILIGIYIANHRYMSK